MTPEGFPVWEAFDPTREWDVDERVNGPAAALEQARKEYERGGGDNFGVRLVAVERSAPLHGDADRQGESADEADQRDLGALE